MLFMFFFENLVLRTRFHESSLLDEYILYIYMSLISLDFPSGGGNLEI